VDVNIKLSGVFEKDENKSFPFFVRAKQNGEFINNQDDLEEYLSLRRKLESKYTFLKPFGLPGCNFSVDIK
jgi:hypothetical protein